MCVRSEHNPASTATLFFADLTLVFCLICHLVGSGWYMAGNLSLPDGWHLLEECHRVLAGRPAADAAAICQQEHGRFCKQAHTSGDWVGGRVWVTFWYCKFEWAW
jgi:hypothetical protein